MLAPLSFNARANIIPTHIKRIPIDGRYRCVISYLNFCTILHKSLIINKTIANSTLFIIADL